MPTYLPKRKSVVEVKNEITNAIKAVAPSYGASEAADFKTLLEQTDQGYWDAISPTRHVPKAVNGFSHISLFVVQKTQL
jgi:acetyl esterase